MYKRNKLHIADTLATIRKVLRLGFRTNKTYFVLLIPILVVQTLQPFPFILVPRYIIDSLQKGAATPEIMRYVAVLALSVLILNSLAVFLNSKKNLALSKMKQEFSKTLSEAIMKTDYALLEDRGMTEKISRAKASISGEMSWATRSLNCEKGLDAIGSELINILSGIFKICGVVFILSSLHPLIMLLIVVVVIINAVTSAVKKREEFTRKQKTTQIGDQCNYFQQLIPNPANGKEIRHNQMRGYLTKKYEQYRKQLINDRFVKYTGNIKVDMINIFVICIQELTVYVYLIYQVLYKAFTIGDFTMYSAAVFNFSSFLTGLIESVLNIKLFAGFMEEYFEVTEQSKENVGSSKEHVKDPQTPRTIEFKDVWFKYPGSDDFVIKGVSIEIKNGEKLSVVGQNGAGKTTFIKLLMRFYKPDRGEILYGGRNINEYCIEEYYKCLTAIFQDFKIFSFTVRENIAFGESSDNGIMEALKMAGLSEKIEELPEGIHTAMFKDFNKEGIELSFGQQQKLAVARAFYKNSGVVVLDEPTAALDPMAEYELYNHFNNLVAGKTAIFISHRMSSSRFCDKIAVFDDGIICEYGSHDELILLKDGLYQRMFSEQAKYYRNGVAVNE